MYIWLRKPYGKDKVNKIIEVADDQWKEFSRNMFLRGYFFKRIPKPPAPRTLRRWRSQGQGRTINGVFTPGYQGDSKGGTAWLAIFDQIAKCNQKSA